MALCTKIVSRYGLCSISAVFAFVKSPLILCSCAGIMSRPRSVQVMDVVQSPSSACAICSNFAGVVTAPQTVHNTSVPQLRQPACHGFVRLADVGLLRPRGSRKEAD